MKKNISYILSIALLVLFFWGCNDKDELKDLRVTAVQSLNEPADNELVVLQASSSATVYFEWNKAVAQDSGMVLYEIAFYKDANGFSTPLEKIVSDNNGAYNYVSVSHEELNYIAGLAGIARGGTGNLVWTVFSSKGINEMQATQYKTLEVTRLNGFDDIPDEAYVTGEGSEGGTILDSAVMMKKTEEGKFEVYTSLTAGHPFYFVSAKTGTYRIFYPEGETLQEGTGSLAVSTTSPYRIELNFNTGSVKLTRIVTMSLYYADWWDVMFDLEYKGKGVWKTEGQAINFETEDWGEEQRYKFRMTVEDDSGNTEDEFWGSVNSDNAQPDNSTPASYYYLYLYSFDNPDDHNWDYCYKFAEEINNSYSDVTVCLQADKEYTHTVVKVGDQ